MAGAETVRSETADALRGAIDRGAAGDKVPGSDPAASPLGTDAEAGGVSPTPGEVLQAADRELAHGGPSVAPDGDGVPRPWPWLLAGAAIAAALAVVVLLVV